MPLMNSAEPAVRLGALGWSNAVLQESFYPAGMPEEWQLSYFSTQFGCVFLDNPTWQQAGSEQMVQWNADTHAQFMFLLEGDPLLPLPVELAGKVLMLRRDDSRILWFARDSSLKVLASALLASLDERPRFLLSQDGDLGQMERVATLLEVMGL